MKQSFFDAHKRVLIKIIPHHNESVYKFELSHRHLFIGALCMVALLLAVLLDNTIIVRQAQAQVQRLQSVNMSERAQLNRFTKQTNVMLQRLHELQKDNQEIRRLTGEVERKHVQPVKPQSAKAVVPHPNRQAQSVSLLPVRASGAEPAESLWQRVVGWISSRQDGGATFAWEAARLSFLDMQLNQTLAESRGLKAKAEAAAATELAREVAHQRYLDDIPSIWPTDGYVSSGFGYRSYPDSEFHPGLDIVNDYDAPVYATAAGIVTMAGWDGGGYGYEVQIDHGNGYVTMYAHESSLLVSEGQYVHKGQQIALVGSTGYATGPHVHYEVIRYGTPIDPTPFLNGIPSELASANPY